jgi:hypothetical protein
MMQKFWWGHKENESKIHWMSWKKMGISKSKRGMGFRDLRCFNLDLLAKQGRRLVQNPNSLTGQILQAKYVSRRNFLEATLGNKPSFVWRNIFGVKDLLKEGLVCIIGDGKSAQIWLDKWLPTPTTYAIQSPRVGLHIDAKICNLIDLDMHW